MVDLTLEIMMRRWPHADQHVAGLAEGIVAAAPTVFPKYGLTSALTIAHAMAQFSHECGAGLEMTENLNYSAQGLINTWPSRFGPARAADYAHNPQRIADAVYGGRMGNDPPPSDDGWNFRGRGLSQVTGRDGYVKLAAKTGLDITNNPDLVSSPENALECGVADFVLCGCLPPAQDDDVNAVTRALNGGYIGLAERRQWLAAWKRELGA
jgi:putative chitinase